MIDSKRPHADPPLTGRRRALGEQLDRIERAGIPMACPLVDVDDGELRRLRRRLAELQADPTAPSNRPISGS